MNRSMRFGVRNISTNVYDAMFMSSDDAFLWKDTEMNPKEFEVINLSTNQPAEPEPVISKRGRSRRSFYGIRKPK